MEITGLAPDAVDIELRFLKPWKATNQVRLSLSLDPHRHRRHLDDARRARPA